MFNNLAAPKRLVLLPEDEHTSPHTVYKAVQRASWQAAAAMGATTRKPNHRQDRLTVTARSSARLRRGSLISAATLLYTVVSRSAMLKRQFALLATATPGTQPP
jgi:hypothetical protein